MKKNWFALLIAVLTLFSAIAFAQEAPSASPAPTYAPDSPQGLAAAALLTEYPEATVNLVMEEYDDGRMYWRVFFQNGTDAGVCDLDEETYEVRKIKTFAMPEDGLTADQALQALIAAKGEVTLTDLELEEDDGRLYYEGEAELDGKRYDFEMTVAGKIVEWERD